MHSGGDLAKIEDALGSVREMEPSRAGVRALVSRVGTESSKVTVFASRTALGEVLGMPTSKGEEALKFSTAKVCRCFAIASVQTASAIIG
jgi:hypothetical protein